MYYVPDQHGSTIQHGSFASPNLQHGGFTPIAITMSKGSRDLLGAVPK